MLENENESRSSTKSTSAVDAKTTSIPDFSTFSGGGVDGY